MPKRSYRVATPKDRFKHHFFPKTKLPQAIQAHFDCWQLSPPKSQFSTYGLWNALFMKIFEADHYVAKAQKLLQPLLRADALEADLSYVPPKGVVINVTPRPAQDIGSASTTEAMECSDTSSLYEDMNIQQITQHETADTIEDTCNGTNPAARGMGNTSWAPDVAQHESGWGAEDEKGGFNMAGLVADYAGVGDSSYASNNDSEDTSIMDLRKSLNAIEDNSAVHPGGNVHDDQFDNAVYFNPEDPSWQDSASFCLLEDELSGINGFPGDGTTFGSDVLLTSSPQLLLCNNLESSYSNLGGVFVEKWGRRYPNFTINYFWGANKDGNPLVNLVLAVVKIVSLTSPSRHDAKRIKANLQLLEYMTQTTAECWSNQLYGIVIVGVQVMVVKWVKNKRDQHAELDKNYTTNWIMKPQCAIRSIFKEKYPDIDDPDVPFPKSDSEEEDSSITNPDSSTVFTDSTGKDITGFAKFPDLTINAIRANPRKHDVVLAICEIGSNLDEYTKNIVCLQLFMYKRKLGVTCWEHKLLGIGIIQNQVLLIMWCHGPQGGNICRGEIGWISIYDNHFIQELEAIREHGRSGLKHGLCSDDEFESEGEESEDSEGDI
ncbi:hypothetical protein FA15DRAFT_708728 [Coprinopsis marcescibilis]|uniref:Uncharacterized protein n=1 Tax=Coprinopsis marcescibilis TaxID=230819 RepID=A0A5C3KUZ0_COPMA|nr:hypothetical protein FA15DRAFT_708728 [Coprinopsis marcescibilis]